MGLDTIRQTQLLRYLLPCCRRLKCSHFSGKRNYPYASIIMWTEVASMYVSREHYLKGNRGALDAFMVLMGYKNPRSNYLPIHIVICKSHSYE